MAGTTYAKNKGNIYRYKREHPERVREINRICENKRYRWKVISITFRRILLDAEAQP